jgi:hypothetical protein
MVVLLSSDFHRYTDVKASQMIPTPQQPRTVKASKSKKRQHPAGSPSPKCKGKKRQQSPTPKAPDYMEYDDQAWVATANNIVAELARTNSLLEKSIEAAEGGRAASEWMCSGLELFLQQQRDFQALLFKEVRLDPQMASDKARMGPDEEEEEDEEMENASGSEEGGSRGDEGSMEM